MARPTWDEYFIGIMDAVAARSTCDRGRSGAVITKNKVIIATGYVGSPKGLPHCDDVGHYLNKLTHEDGTVTEHCLRTIHAEQNAICQAAKCGVSVYGGTIYSTMTPCRICAAMIINSGIKRVVSKYSYQDSSDAIDKFLRSGVSYLLINDEVPEYVKR